jgi:hypothetical protein
MSKDFITVGIQSPEYDILREALESWIRDNLDWVTEERKEEINALLCKLGLGDLTEEVKTYPEYEAEMEEEMAQVPYLPPDPYWPVE